MTDSGNSLYQALIRPNKHGERRTIELQGEEKLPISLCLLFLNQDLRFSYYHEKCSDDSPFKDPQVLLETCEGGESGIRGLRGNTSCFLNIS